MPDEAVTADSVNNSAETADAELEAKQAADVTEADASASEEAAVAADAGDKEGAGVAGPATAPVEVPTTFDVDGEDVPVEALKEAYQQAHQAQEKFSQVENVVKQLREQPAETMLQILTAQNGGSKEKGFAALVSIAEQVIAYHLKREELSPEERRSIELEEENKTLKQKQAEREAAEQEAVEAEAMEEATAAIVTEMSDALKTLSIADTPRTRQRIAKVVSDKWSKGLSKYTVADGARAVKAALAKEAEQRKKEFFDSLKPEDLTEDQIRAIQSHNVQAAKRTLTLPKTGDGREGKGRERVQLPRRVARIV